MREYAEALANPPVTAPTPPRTTPTWQPTNTPPGPSPAQIAQQQAASAQAAQAAADRRQREAEARAKAEADKLKQKAADKYAGAADRLMKQAAALKTALGSSGYKKALTQQLKNVDLRFNEQDALVLDQYARGRKELERKETTTRDELDTGTNAALSNAGRERSEALMSVVAQGASGSDSLRAQAASLRNWNANAREVQSNYVDALDSLNSANSEMVNMVRSQRQNAWRSREEQRGTLYNRYYDQMSQTWTDYGNKMGEAGNMWDSALEQWDKDKGAWKKKLKTSNAESEKAFKEAAKLTGQTYTERATSSTIKNWKGAGDFEYDSNPNRWARPQLEYKESEGATLRRWNG
jgi:hypothetical protein